MADIAELTRLIEPEAKAEGFELVRVKMMGGVSDPTLQVMAERPDTGQLTLDDCARLSRRLSDLLDSVDPIQGAYRLEVSSPGIDRPLTRPRDYEAWAGHEARISLRDTLNGRKQYSGVLAGFEDRNVLIEIPGQGRIALPLDAIHSAKLVMTDKLIEATAPLSAEGADQIEQTEAEED